MNVADSESAQSFRIELFKQQIVTLANLPKHLPKRRGGRPFHIGTGFRMAKDGSRRKSDGAIIKLPTINVGGTKCTSLEAFQWFSEQLSREAPAGSPAPTGDVRSPAARDRAVAAAEKKLDELGVGTSPDKPTRGKRRAATK